jgi:hypothetical protein
MEQWVSIPPLVPTENKGLEQRKKQFWNITKNRCKSLNIAGKTKGPKLILAALACRNGDQQTGGLSLRVYL